MLWQVPTVVSLCVQAKQDEAGCGRSVPQPACRAPPPHQVVASWITHQSIVHCSDRTFQELDQHTQCCMDEDETMAAGAEATEEEEAPAELANSLELLAWTSAGKTKCTLQQIIVKYMQNA